MYQSKSSQPSLETKYGNNDTDFISLVHRQQAFDNISRMYRQKELCDVTLIVGDLEIPAHKIILAASSLFFYTRFSRIGRKHSNRMIIEQIDGHALMSLVEYIYTSKIHITVDNVKDILIAANLLVLTEVQVVCCNFLKANLNPSNCLSIGNLASQYNYPNLKMHAENYVEVNFSEVVECEEFLALHPQEVSKLICMDNINVASEETVFESLLTWVHKDEAGRRHYLYSLMEHIRLPLLTPEYLLLKLEDPLLKDDLIYKDIVMEVLKNHILKRDKPDIRPRNLIRSSKKLVVFGSDADWKLILEIYDFKKEEWIDRPTKIGIEVTGGAAIVAHERKVFLIGGYSKNVHVYDIESGSWALCHNMSEERSGMGVAVLNNFIYIVGGYNGNEDLDTAEMYDYQTGQWIDIAPIAEGRSFLGLAPLNEELYAVGGRNESALRSVEVFNPNWHIWSPAPDLLTPREYPGVCALDGILYVVGGYNHVCLHSVEAFDPVKSRWTEVAPLHLARCRAAVMAIDGLLYVIGGMNGTQLLKSIEVYNPKTNEWIILPQYMKNGMDNVSATLTSF